VLFDIHAAEYRKRIKYVIKKRVNVVHTSLANLVRAHHIQEWLEAIGIFYFCFLGCSTFVMSLKFEKFLRVS
jgi:hypothetical protein